MVDIVLGGFIGDEGKGKVVKYLSRNADIVVRCFGGSNTGTSLVINDKKYLLRMIPISIENPNIVAVIGNGVAIDPKILVSEINLLKKNGFNLNNLKISEKAHVILPYHIKLDILEEELRGINKLGTTLCGIGPVYSDKAKRCGIRVQDFVSNRFSKILKINIEEKNKIFELYGKEKDNFDEIYEEYSEYSQIIAPYVCDTVNYLQDAVKQNKRIICEGSQATLLDVDLGTYPYVTATSGTIGGILNGTGLNYKQIGEVYGVVKAYSSRDGEGPFLTEEVEDEEVVNKIRDIGREVGSITKRQRRCGWLDLNALKYAVQVNRNNISCNKSFGCCFKIKNN